MHDRRLYLLITRALCRLPPLRVAERAIAGGVDAVQFREKTVDAAARAWLGDLAALCRERRVPLLINDDVELALAVDAAGVHVGQEDLPALAARHRLGPGRVLGVSTHDQGQARRAVAEGADYLGVGPCYATATKGYAEGLGAERIGALARSVAIPAFAIGGITPERVPELVRHGIRRIAVSSAVLGSDDPRAVAAAFCAALPLVSAPGT